MDRCRRQIGRDLNDANRFLRQGEDVAGLREPDAPQQRLHMKSVGNDHERLKRIGQAKRRQILRGNKDRQAMGLKAPELVVIDKIVELLGDSGAAPLVDSGRLQLFRGASCEVLELDSVALRLRSDRCCAQVDRYATLAAKGGQSRDVARSRYVHI